MPKTKTPLTPIQQEQFRVATNRVSLESIKYAAEIVGYTDLVTATVAALERFVETASGNCRTTCNDLRVLYQRAKQSTVAAEPLLDAILTASRWANSEGKGGFAVGNIVDPIMHAKTIRSETHDDEKVYQRLEDIRSQWLTPYYEQLKKDQGKSDARKHPQSGHNEPHPRNPRTN
jgi:hypothetical protein